MNPDVFSIIALMISCQALAFLVGHQHGRGVELKNLAASWKEVNRLLTALKRKEIDNAKK